MDPFFIEEWRAERDENRAFRKEMIHRVGNLETRAAAETHVKRVLSRRFKSMIAIATVLVSLAGLVLPILLQ